MGLLVACQDDSGRSAMNPAEALDAEQFGTLKQWMQANGLDEASFRFESSNHQGAYSVLLAGGQIQAIKSKGVSTLSGLSALPALQSLNISLTDGADLSACPAQLQHLKINARPTEPLSLSFLQQCPNLFELELFHAKLNDLNQLQQLSQLQSLKIRFGAAAHLDLSFSLPALTQLNLSNNQLQSLTFSAPQEQLKSLFLSHNQFTVLPDLSALSVLETLSLDDNPLLFVASDHWPPALKNLDLRKTAITNLEPLLGLSQLQRVQVQRKPKTLPAELADKIFPAVGSDSQLAVAEDIMEKYLGGLQFIEQLPKSVIGKALGLSKESAQHFSMSGTSKLSGHITLDELQGLMRITLAQTDDLLYQQRQLSINGEARVSEGAFRIYSPVKLDFWQMAGLFVDHPQRDAPASSDFKRTGFVVYEAMPGQPVTFQANLIAMADRYLLLVGSDSASDINITYE